MISISGQTGELVPLCRTAHGNAMLADPDEAELRRLFGSGALKAYTANTTLSIDALTTHCGQIRSRSLAEDEGEYVDWIRCLAAPTVPRAE